MSTVAASGKEFVVIRLKSIDSMVCGVDIESHEITRGGGGICKTPSPLSLRLRIMQSFPLQHTAHQLPFYSKPISITLISASFSLFIFLVVEQDYKMRGHRDVGWGQRNYGR